MANPDPIGYPPTGGSPPSVRGLKSVDLDGGSGIDGQAYRGCRGRAKSGRGVFAKAAALRDLGLSAPEVIVFEKSAIGGAWRGDGGYTDGDSRLCTPIVRDLGFPYASSGMGARAAKVMLAKFSWPAFLIDKGGKSYARWINRGSPRPLHGTAEYLGGPSKRAILPCTSVGSPVSPMPPAAGRSGIRG